jgi:hypothetical protein
MARTTIDLDDAVLRKLKQRKEREGKTLGRLVSELLARALSSEEPPQVAPFSWTTAPMQALVDLEDKEALRRALERS